MNLLHSGSRDAYASTSQPQDSSRAGTAKNEDDSASDEQTESSSLVSKNSAVPPSLTLVAFNNQRSSRKRRNSAISFALQPKLKQPKPAYSDHYRMLFNESVNEITAALIAKKQNSEAGQNDIVFWSSAEKLAFSHALINKGRHDHKGIAKEIGSKSEPEVYLYQELLQKATVDQQLYEPAKKLFSPHDVDAALEVSESCCVALDRAAEVLASLQQKEEEKIERVRHPDLAVLTPKIAKSIERLRRNCRSGEIEISAMLPASTLLNLRNFLTLSKHFFMNSELKDMNWRTHTERAQPPMMMYTAFSDLDTLVTSITRKMVQTCLFTTMSRLRATNTPGRYVPQQHVRSCDVVAALDILCIKANSRDFWAGTARKCRLRVYETVKRGQVSGRRYNYNEVEEILSSECRGRSRAKSISEDEHSMTTDEPSDLSSLERNSSTSVSSDSIPPDDEEVTYSSDQIDTSRSNGSQSGRSAREQERIEEVQDTNAEARDQQASFREEERLWKVLGQDPSFKPDFNEVLLPKSPNMQRKLDDDIADWTACLDYAGEWETMRSPIPESSFIENWERTLGRDNEIEVRTTGSGSSEEELLGEVSSDEESDSNDSLQGKPRLTESEAENAIDQESDDSDGDILGTQSEVPEEK